MVRITTDRELRDRLGDLTEPMELFDENGRLLGRFVPSRQLPRTHPADRCPYTPEELAAMRAEEGGRPLAEIWKDLGRE